MAKIRKKAKKQASDPEARVEPSPEPVGAREEEDRKAPSPPPPPAPPSEARGEVVAPAVHVTIAASEEEPHPGDESAVGEGPAVRPDPPPQAADGTGQAESSEAVSLGAVGEPEPSHRERVLLFSVGREHYAMSIQDISLIIDNRPATPVPCVPPFVVGIVSLRGRIVTILDARRRLALGEAAAPEGAKVVVLDRGADQFGVLVDNIVHVLEVDRSAMEPPPEGFLPGEREFVNGVFYHKGVAVASLDLEKFLDFQV